MLSALATAILLAASPNATTELQGSVGVGAGYDSNLDLASSRATTPAIGSATLSAWADLGWSFTLRRGTSLYAGARWDGEVDLDASDLSHQVPGVDLTLVQELGETVALVVAPGFGWLFYGDSTRNGPKLSGRAALRWRPIDWLSIRGGYSRAQNWATAPVFSLGVNRVFANVEARIARRSYLAAGYALSWGGQVLYRLVAVRNPRRAGAFATLEPFQANATEHTFSARWEQGLWRDLYVTVSYEHTRGSSVQGAYAVNSVFGGVGWRF